MNALEFPKVLRAIANHVHSPVSREAVMEFMPLVKLEDINRRAALIAEFRRLMDESSSIGIRHFEDVRPALNSIRPEGAILEGTELLLFVPAFDSLLSLASTIRGHEECPALREAVSEITGFPELLKAIERSIDDDGRIKDTASYELQEIRQRIRNLTGRIRSKLEELTRDPGISDFLQDTFVTQRSGRWVIPVRMDSKGMVKGVVHDVSRTGETAFMEPLELIGLSNELENLTADERTEEIRILRSLSARIREQADEVRREFKILVDLDCLSSAASFSRSLGAEPVTVTESGVIKLHKARHPLLLLHRREGVVPLDVTLGGKELVMTITGPNAGGKTIAIKTIGLLLVMALTGLPVPAASSSELPLLDTVLVDIGDEQSIEADLSTFSAHVSNIARIVREAGSKTLVLMDELGTGTDPAQGAALGSAVLQDLMTKGSMVFATTHLVDVVAFVHRNKGMLNASMAFDEKTFTPLYRLKTGEPGQSHALEIAERFGLPQDIIRNARKMMGTMQAELQELLRDIEHRRVEYDNELEKIRQDRIELQQRNLELSERLSRAETEKRAILENAYREAKDLLREYKRSGMDALDEIKRTKSKAPLKELESRQQEVEEKLRELEPEPESAAIGDITIGSRVELGMLNIVAEVVGIDAKRGRLRVKAGDKELEVSARGVQLAGETTKKAPAVRYTGRDMDENVSNEINLIGMRVEEAESALEAFLNRASLAGLNEVRIIHGIGSGILRGAIREYLTGHPLAKNFRPGEQSEGGDGATVVLLS